MSPLAVILLALIGLVVVGPPAQAVGSYDNGRIAEIALSKVGQYGGQCKTFVNNMVSQASSGTQWPAPGYQSGFQNAGGVEVSSSAAAKGDIIQVGNSDYDWPLHTAIVVTNNGGGNFTVVDSNWGNNEIVSTHRFNPYTWAPNSLIKIWRMGTLPTPPPPPPAGYQSFMGDWNGDGVVDVGLRNPNTGKFFARFGPTFSDATQVMFQWDNSTLAYQSFMGDWNGDGVVDVGLRNPSTGMFYARYGPSFTSQTEFQWDNSTPNYQSFMGDFNGDNFVDVGLRYPGSGVFYVRYGPSFGAQTAFQWDNSLATYQAFVGDFNRDNVVDVGLRNPSTGMFYARYGPSFTTQTNFQWDNSTNYQSFMGDWNRDGVYDIGLRDPGNGMFYARHGYDFSSGGQVAFQWDKG